MTAYEKWVLPWLTDLAMRNKEATRYRSQLVPGARGMVLEVGVGSGLNLPFYGREVSRLFVLDPSEALLRMARKKAERASFPVECLARSGEEIPMREMRRVLKPDGVLIFAEHGLSPDAGVRGWQERLNPVWRKVTGGCNLNRKPDALIQAAGFTIAQLEAAYAKGPRPMSYMYAGRAHPGTHPA